MFDRDRWTEVFQSISKNKLRSILSGFTVAFAILLFTLLFGMGKGLENNFKEQFAGTSINTIFLWPERTTKPYKGLKSERLVKFKNDDLDYIKEKFSSKIDILSPVLRKSLPVTYKTKKYSYPVKGVYPGFDIIESSEIIQGRFFNDRDLKANEKVVVIGKYVENDLFGNKSAYGKYLNIGGILYKVIGVFTDAEGERDERNIYAPFTTIQNMYGKGINIDEFVMLYNSKMSLDEGVRFSKTLKKAMKQKHSVSPRDTGGIGVYSYADVNSNVSQMMGGLSVLIIVIGLGTLIAGIVGISNIMVYVVKERTKELGIRKAIGASPRSIVSMIMFEAILITTIAGYVGLFLGVGILKFATPHLKKFFILNPGVSTGIVVGASITLILAGTIAGYLPAKRASRIKPIEALRAD